jgi:hypothetical protein
MKIKLLLFFALIITVFHSTCAQSKQILTPKSGTLKPRIVILTDVSTWETDDSESLVRLLVHADLFEIEGLVYTTGWSLDKVRDDFFQLIHNAIDAYEKDLPNLLKRSNQKEFLKDESKQEIGYWPGPEYLRKQTMFGSKNRGFSFIGETNDSPGSDLIIKLADEQDDRPLWIAVWGGGNTLAQAIWRIQQNRSPEDLNAFLHKLHVYTITDQDREQRTEFSISSHQWIRGKFEKDLFFIWDECAWKFQNGTGRENWEEYATHIQNHGNLGSVYPKFKYGVEGDTPSFLYLMPNGLNNPEIPDQASLGGYFKWGKSEDGSTSAYINYSGSPNSICNYYENYFYKSTFNNFAARMDWAKDGKGNRNPIVIIDKSTGFEILKIKPEQGTSITLDASKSFDPDGDTLRFKWWILSDAGTYSENVSILKDDSNSPIVKVPTNSAGKTFHVICEVTDSGTPNLTGYRRIIFEPTN